MSLHASAYKGQRVFIRLKDGTKFDDVFLDRTSRCVVLKQRGRIEVKLLKAMTVYREKPFRWIKAEHMDHDQAREFPNICPIQDWVRGTFVVGLGGTGAEYTTCHKLLTEDGKCEDHGKVRFKPYEKPEESKHAPPSLNPYPPRRRGQGRTRPIRTYNGVWA